MCKYTHKKDKTMREYKKMRQAWIHGSSVCSYFNTLIADASTHEDEHTRAATSENDIKQ